MDQKIQDPVFFYCPLFASPENLLPSTVIILLEVVPNFIKLNKVYQLLVIQNVHILYIPSADQLVIFTCCHFSMILCLIILLLQLNTSTPAGDGYCLSSL